MKKILLVLFICTAGLSFAQTKVPDKVKSAFDNKYPNSVILKCEEDDDEFTLDFTKDSLNYFATFTDDGKWIETGTLTSFDVIPEAVKKSVKDKFSDSEIKNTYKIENFKGLVYYEVDVVKNGKNIELYYNKDGSEADDD